MRFSMLGAVLAGETGVGSDLGGRHGRALLSLLVARFPAEARREWLEDQIWGGTRTSDSALRVLVLRLRRALADVGLDGAIRTTPNGYVLDVGERTAASAIDFHRFESSIDRAIEARGRRDDAAAVELLGEALGLWRGEAFEAVECEALEPVRRRLALRRVDAVQHLASALVELGEFDAAARLVASEDDAQLERDRLTAVGMIALVRLGRPAEALRAAERLRRRLHDELGIDAGDEVRALEAWARSGVEPTSLVSTVLRDGLPERPATVDRPLPGRLQRLTATSLLGRDAELADLQAALDRGTGVVCVAGDAGIGKTRFLAEVAVQAHRRGRHVIHLTCHPSGEDGHDVVTELVRHLLEHGDPGRDLTDVAVEPLDDRPGDLVAEAVVRRARLLAAVRGQFERRDRRPVLVVIDDVQWMGAASVRFVTDLLSEGGRTQWAVGWRSSIDVDHRSGLSALVSSPDVWRCDLRSLDDAAITDLARAVLEPQEHASALDDVVARAGGNPLFAWELARYVATGGDPHHAPPDLRRIVRRSIDVLGDEALRAVRLAALVHQGYPTDVLMRLVVRSDDAAEALDSLQRAGVLESLAGDRWYFRHPLVEQAVIDDIGDALRARLHLELAAAVIDDPRAVAVAGAHLVDAGALADPVARDAAIARALEQLIASGTYDVAVPLARRWQAVATGGAVTAAGVAASIAAATSLLAANDTVAALRLLDAARAAAAELGRPELRADAELARGPLGARRMTPEQIDDIVGLADQLDSGDTRRRIELICWAAHHAVLAGDAVRARELVDLAAAVDPHGRSVAMSALVHAIRYHATCGVDSPPSAATEAYGELVRLDADVHSPPLLAMVHLFGLTESLRYAEPERFRRHLDGLRDTVRLMPRPDLYWWIDVGEACLAVASGADDAVELVERASATANRLHVTFGLSAGALHHVLLAWERGTIGDLRQLLGHEVTPADPARWVMYLLACLEAGELGIVRDELGRLDPFPLASVGELWSSVGAVLSTVVFAASDARWARALLAELEPHAGHALSMHGVAYLGAVDAHLGRLAAVVGRSDAAALLAAGARIDERMGARPWAARARRDAASLGAPVTDAAG